MTLHRNPLATALLAALAIAPLCARAADDAGHDPAQAKKLGAVQVTADADKGYHADSAQVDTFGSFGNAPLHDTPASVTVITRDLIDDRQPRTLSELVRTDASVGDNYAPVGYYQDLAIRGFVLDLATAYRMNDMTINGEQLTPLEDKQRVEILKGLGGLEAGIIAPGGIVNYVTKRPADVRTATLGTDSHGSRYAAVDMGAWLTPNFGLRVNAAHEDMHSYVQHTPGRRSFLSLAADWKISDRATLQLDTDYQTSGQRSVSGYQLLGGTTIPAHPSNTRLLGYEPWQQPVGIHSSNTTARFDYRFSDRWSARLSAGHSHTVINDNVAFAYGCFYAPQCATGAYPGNFFAPNGDYDIYDFRSPGDTRQNDEVRAVLKGGFDTGSISHEVSLGASAFRRTLDQRPYVYDYVGTGNIDQVIPPYFAPSPNQPGPSARTFSSWQRALFGMDRVHLGEQWQVLAGARFVRLHERAWDDSGQVLQRDTRLSKTLPQAAVMWQPTAPLTVYASYSENLALGAEAPYWTTNGGQMLAPVHSRQIETGVKYDWSDTLSLQAALYRIRQPYQFAQPDNSAAGFTFVQRGQEAHTGLELGADGRISDDLRLTASANLIQARASHSGTPAYEGHQIINVPRLRTSVYMDYRLPFAHAFGLLAGWRYASANPATPDGRTRVPAYNVFDAGLRYATAWDGHPMTWHLSVDNVFNRFYWRDTGGAYGDTYLFPGAPRLARLSVTVGF
ncbi:MAG: TonB-dependent siderophore receptor [Lysobacterales bacterium 14-68-21]|jgi:iron complex outermembrane receptor protein|nr:MAG: TonB-dependent siderophore receptor [Xanthomonadales bacterium 15-68-25]OZB66671.1 MAG: TonB-dependent siderophore receptor [Xanthomonadales bacterium 14-68-21]